MCSNKFSNKAAKTTNVFAKRVVEPPTRTAIAATTAKPEARQEDHNLCDRQSKIRNFEKDTNKNTTTTTTMMMNHQAADDHQELHLTECDFTQSDSFQSLIEVLEDTGLCTEVVDLSATKFASTSDFLQVLDTIQMNHHKIKDLKLSNFLCSNYLAGGDTKGSLERLLKSNATLQKLDLSGHPLDHAAVQDLTRGLQQNASLVELKLHNCGLDETSAAWVLQSASTNLRLLDLGANNQHLSPDFLNTHVVQLLENSTSLETLILDHCSELFVAQHASELAPFWKALQRNQHLKSLSLRFCRISQHVGEALFQALTVNTTLTHLNLEFAGFGLRDQGGDVLLRYLPQLQGLQDLRLIVRYQGPKATRRLLKAVALNQSLTHFAPRMDDFKSQRTLVSLLERNRRSAQAQTLLCPDVSPATLPHALSQLSRSSSGSAASFQVLQYWMAECI